MSDLFIAARRVEHDGSRTVIAAGKVERPVNVLDAIIDAAMAAEAEYAKTRRPDGRGWGMPPRDQVRRLLAAAFPLIAAEERARIRDLLPYNVNCCEGFPAAVADMIGEHGYTPWASLSAEDEAGIEAVKRAGRKAWEKFHGGAS